LIQRRLRTCQACGFRSLNSEVCPACGTLFTAETAAEPSGPSAGQGGPSFDASDVTVDVSATDLGSD
jgi:hypothetical protein